MPDPTEPRVLFPLKISETLENTHAWLKVEHREGIYAVYLGWPGGLREATGTNLSMALTNLAIKIVED